MIEEIAHRRLRHLKKVRGRLLNESKAVGRHISATVAKTYALLETLGAETRDGAQR